MKNRGLISAYTKKKYKHLKTVGNEASVPNLLNRQYSNRKQLEVLVNDLTYVKVGNKWRIHVCSWIWPTVNWQDTPHHGTKMPSWFSLQSRL